MELREKNHRLFHWILLISAALAYLDSKSWIYVTIGLLTVLVLSRLFGSGWLIWNAVMGEGYRAECKAIIQEGLELFGYIFIFYGSWLLPERHWHRRSLP